MKENKTHLSNANDGGVIWVLKEDVVMTTVALEIIVIRYNGIV